MENRNGRVIGVTGGIGCGMTTVSQCMQDLGGKIVSGDGIARENMKVEQPAYKAVVNTFGKDILLDDGTIDRKKLGDLVFGNLEKLQLLNKIVHPFWMEKMNSVIQQSKKENPGVPVIVDAAILLETGLLSKVDKLVVVTSPIRLRRERIRARDFLDECQIDQRINAQIPVSEKAKKADFVIENTGTMEQTQQKVKQIWNELTGT